MNRIERLSVPCPTLPCPLLLRNRRLVSIFVIREQFFGPRPLLSLASLDRRDPNLRFPTQDGRPLDRWTPHFGES
jgi:hypothetical protein